MATLTGTIVASGATPLKDLVLPGWAAMMEASAVPWPSLSALKLLPPVRSIPAPKLAPVNAGLRLLLFVAIPVSISAIVAFLPLVSLWVSVRSSA